MLRETYTTGGLWTSACTQSMNAWPNRQTMQRTENVPVTGQYQTVLDVTIGGEGNDLQEAICTTHV